MSCDESFYRPSGARCSYQQAVICNALWTCRKGYQPQYIYLPGAGLVTCNCYIVNVDGFCNGAGTCVAVYYYPPGPLTNMWVWTGSLCPPDGG